MTGTAGATGVVWQAATASRRGSSHTGDVPNQDAVRCEQPPDQPGSDLWVAAISDGHGGARYVRSDVGARLAVDIAVESMLEAVTNPGVEPPVDLLRREIPGIVAQWRRTVLAHAAEHPFADTEVQRSGGLPLADDPIPAYGATLLVALVGEQGVGVAQVGDGDALIRTNGFATRPVPGDPRLVAGETTSLCLETAVDDFRYAGLPATADPDLVLLATDGYGNSFARPDWWHELVDDMAGFLDTFGFDALATQLPDWLAESARVGGDDVSAAVFVRRPSAASSATTDRAQRRPAQGARPPVSPEPPVRSRTLELPREDTTPRQGPARSRRAAVLAVAGLLACLALALLVVVLMSDGDQDPTIRPGDEVSSSDTPAPERTRTRPPQREEPETPRTPGSTPTPRPETPTTTSPTPSPEAPQPLGSTSAPPQE